MDTQAERLIDAFESIEANDLRQRSQRAFRMAVMLGLAATASFGLIGILILLSALGLSPLGRLTSVWVGFILLAVMAVAVPACWIFTGRSAYLRTQLLRRVRHAAPPSNA